MGVGGGGGGMGVGFIMEGDVEFLVSLHSWQRDSKPPFY